MFRTNWKSVAQMDPGMDAGTLKWLRRDAALQLLDRLVAIGCGVIMVTSCGLLVVKNYGVLVVSRICFTTKREMGMTPIRAHALSEAMMERALRFGSFVSIIRTGAGERDDIWRP